MYKVTPKLRLFEIEGLISVSVSFEIVSIDIDILELGHWMERQMYVSPGKKAVKIISVLIFSFDSNAPFIGVLKCYI